MTGSSTRPSLYQVLVRQPGRDPTLVPVRAFPFLVGRSPDCTLCLEAPGVWPRHLRVTLDPADGLHAAVEGAALATVQDAPLLEGRMRHGDVVRFGPVALQFLVSPPARHSLRAWEIAVWVVLVAIGVFQVVTLFVLPHD